MLRVDQPANAVRLALFMLAYMAGAGASYWMSPAQDVVATFWPPSGIYLAVLLVSDRRRWPYFVAAAFAADITSEMLFYRFPLSTGAVLALGNTLEAVAGAYLVTRICGPVIEFRNLREVLCTTLIAGLSTPMISATIGAPVAVGALSQPFEQAWILFWAGDAVGVLTVAPLVIVALTRGRQLCAAAPARAVEAIVLTLALALAADFLFGGRLPFSYIIIPPLLWAALRFGIPGAAASVGFIAVLAAVYTRAGYTPLSMPGFDGSELTLAVQMFLAVISLSTHILAALVEQRELTLHALERANEVLESRVLQRTAALHASEQQYRALNEQAADGIFVSDAHGNLADVNTAGAHMLGYTREELTKLNIVDVVDEAEQKSLPCDASANGAEVGRAQWSFRRKDGTRFIGEVASCRMVDGRHQAIVRDITRRVKAEIQLDVALTAAEMGTWVWDISSDALKADARLCKLLGLPDGGLATAGEFQAMVHPEDLPNVLDALQKCIDGQEDYSQEFRITTADGKLRWIGGRGRLIPEPDGRTREIAGVNFDITARKDAELRLRLQQTTLSRYSRLGTIGALAGELAHELNQPLAAARTYARLTADALEQVPPALDMACEGAAKIVAQIDRASGVVQRIRKFIQLGHGSPEPCDTRRLIEDAIEVMRPEIARAGIVVKHCVSEGVATVQVDSLQIGKVLINLIRNSVEAIAGKHGRAPAGGIIAIEVRQDGPAFARFSVRDSGPGFRQELVAGLPPPLTTTKPDGLGLGLALSRSIVEAHGGKLCIEKTDAGAAVHFSVPHLEETTS
ncbi:MAG: MASE1 domain-containing protein [Hyphomicrobium sp.]|jgi:PAS domain S-box-containing protein